MQQALSKDLGNLRQEISFGKAFNNEANCQDVFPEDHRAPAQELAEKFWHLH